MSVYLPLILASSSPSRLALLTQAGLAPDLVIPADIDEQIHKGELPKQLALRLAQEKAAKIASTVSDGYILGADTVSACGRLVLGKAETDEQVADCMRRLSGRRHDVFTGVYVIKKQNNQIIAAAGNVAKTTLKFKRLAEFEIRQYIESGDGLGKSGGCKIDGFVENYVTFISGASYSNVVGLPLYLTRSLLIGLGYKK